MVRNMRRGHNGAFKAKADLEAITLKEKRLYPRFPVNLGCMPIRLANGVSNSLMNSRTCFPITVRSEIKNKKIWSRNSTGRSVSSR